MEIESSLNSFKIAAYNHGVATHLGDYKKANENYKSILKAVNFLKLHKSIYKLSELINDSDVSVQLWAATYLLLDNPEAALNKLKEISNDDGIMGFNAKTTISEWQKGNLKL
jgi:hypothetical protein